MLLCCVEQARFSGAETRPSVSCEPQSRQHRMSERAEEQATPTQQRSRRSELELLEKDERQLSAIRDPRQPHMDPAVAAILQQQTQVLQQMQADRAQAEADRAEMQAERTAQRERDAHVQEQITGLLQTIQEGQNNNAV